MAGKAKKKPVAKKKPALETATFAAGCFWGVERAFCSIKGIVSTEVGYAGGKTKNPTYEQVSTGKTGHAESIRVVFDPKVVSYKELLEAFWKKHDPTTPNRQGLDFGSQYRSIIFYHSKKQQREAEASKEALGKSGRYWNKIVTEIVPAKEFYRAEEYHQKYFQKRGGGTCGI
jgi:peptide-methionine (S)-S-oxide reductase